MGLRFLILLLFASTRSSVLLAQSCRTDCPDSIFRSCPCPAGCDQTYCEKACIWVGCHSCVYQCRGCTCGGWGLRERDKVAGAGESTLVESSDVDVREIETGLGSFLILKRGADALGEASARLGLRLRKTGDELVAADVEKGSPAAKAGLASGDALLSIDGKATKELSLQAALEALRGNPGTKARLVVRSKGKPGTRTVVVVRSKVLAPRGTGGVRIEEVPLADGETSCPALKKDCEFLDLDGGYCLYACRAAR